MDRYFVGTIDIGGITAYVVHDRATHKWLSEFSPDYVWVDDLKDAMFLGDYFYAASLVILLGEEKASLAAIFRAVLEGESDD